MPSTDEEILDIRKGHVMTEFKALHLRATKTFVDCYNKKRKAGDEWLITKDIVDTHIQDVYEEIIAEKWITILASN